MKYGWSGIAAESRAHQTLEPGQGQQA